jgi:hypothetical protein
MSEGNHRVLRAHPVLDRHIESEQRAAVLGSLIFLLLGLFLFFVLRISRVLQVIVVLLVLDVLVKTKS